METPIPNAPDVTIYTDGSCWPNPGPGGWAFSTSDGVERSGGMPHTTNNRMELTAIILALHSLPEPSNVTWVTDSMYCVRTLERKPDRQGHYKGKKNRDLARRLRLVAKRHFIVAQHVRGHTGDLGNERVDVLAGEARIAISP